MSSSYSARMPFSILILQRYPSPIRRARHAARSVARAARATPVRTRGDLVGGGVGGIVVVVVDEVVGTRSSAVVEGAPESVTAAGPNPLPRNWRLVISVTTRKP